ncbi:AAA family ATPase [Pseudoduganella namucuonensis]|uniref:Predicted ATP-binding protein involved in virulence n=1 Tax=Pseudoduganella namucuonensis TaxID=1035707 RepID=A0A1I7KJQ1_9BURK|nr:AAA family ATPase [Pseudoduganella namucuonensis]SFU97641.1 Predicted ATP-binding protein involved in virulence [Pseudoduganella namucuonensis]
MKLKRIHLRNFRCFDELVVDFGPQLTVIIAENGAGKTAILDAIAIGFGRYLTKLPGVTGRTVKDTDLRVAEGERRTPYMMLAWEAESIDGLPIVWASGRKRDSAVTTAEIKKLLSNEQAALMGRGLRELNDFTLGLVQKDSFQQAYFLPVIAYYGTNRAIREEVQGHRGSRKNPSRFDALANSLDPDSRFQAAFEWFSAMEDVERRERGTRRDFDYRHPDLDVVRGAIVRMLPPGFSNPRTEVRPLRFVIDRIMPDGVTRTLRVNELSDGYRVVLGLAMDLARRMAQANSRAANGGMQIVNPLDLPAIALIDEVDLHLHPSWQQKVLDDLMRTFRNTQFIVTTHSPQVISTVKREDIRVVGPDGAGRIIAAPPIAMTYGEPSGDVLQSVMMVDPQPPVTEKADLQRLTEWVDQGRYQSSEATDLMQSLTAALGEQHPQLQRLRRSIHRQESLKR